jgi:APA family basic amino acid/polyamine antiporter
MRARAPLAEARVALYHNRMSAPTFPSRSLPRTIGVKSALALVVGTTIGSGIFRSPAGIADKLPGPLPLFSIWVMGGVFALCGALTLAEVASALPQTGGLYVFVRHGWGRLPAFLFGWSELVIIRAAALGAIAITFAQYFFRVLGYNPLVQPYDAYAHYLAAGAILFTAALNIVGVRWGALVNNVTTTAKFGGLAFIIILAFVIGLPRTGGFYTPLAPPGSFTLAPFGLALVSVLWAFDGWADLGFAAGEVKDPQRNLPIALIGGTLAVLVIYLSANLAYMAVLPVSEIRHSPLVAADAAQRLIGPAGVAFVSITVMVSTFGSLNASMFVNPRVFFAMADDGLFFRSVAAVHPRFKTPYVAIGLAAALGAGFVLLRTFEELADTFVTAILPFYALGVAAIFVLRKRAGYTPAFRTPGYPVVPALFIISTVYLLINAVVDPNSRWATLAVFAVILIGVPVFYVTVGRRATAGEAA